MKFRRENINKNALKSLSLSSCQVAGLFVNRSSLICAIVSSKSINISKSCHQKFLRVEGQESTTSKFSCISSMITGRG
jgi:hypothetical protein